MALILEIIDASGASTLHRLRHFPTTLGRALSNDIIVNDAYVDGQHVELACDEAGALRVSDLGSLNGTHASGVRLAQPAVASAGSEMRIGRTLLRFRDVNEAVAPALIDDATHTPQSVVVTPAVAAPVGASTGVIAALARVLMSTAGRVSVIVAMVAATCLRTWLGNTDRSSGGEVFSAGLAAIAIAVFWGAIWSVANRAPDKRSQLGGHVAVASLAFLVLLAWDSINNWLTFIFPGTNVNSAVYLVVFLATVTGLIVGHLSISRGIPWNARWRAALAFCGVLLALGLAATLVNDDKFSDVPKFAAELRPVSPVLIPTSTLSEFTNDMREMKGEVDKIEQIKE